MDVLLNFIQESRSLKLCFSSRFVTLKYKDYTVSEVLCVEVDGM